MKTSKNPLETLTEGERHRFGQWLSESEMLAGIREASKSRSPHKKFVVLQVLEGARIRAEKGSAPLWRPLGATFRKREAALYQRVESAAALIRAANPEDPENPKDPARYENPQKLFDYLSGKETPSDPDLKAESAELRKEIRQFQQAPFRGLRISMPGRRPMLTMTRRAGSSTSFTRLMAERWAATCPGNYV